MRKTKWVKRVGAKGGDNDFLTVNINIYIGLHENVFLMRHRRRHKTNI